jgi:hypothetical protein
MKEDFHISSEGDCERVAAILIKWLKTNKRAELKKKHTIAAPHERWALMFESIYGDEIVNHDLQDVATANIIDLTFIVEVIDHSVQDALSNMSDEELLEALGDFLAEREDADDDDDDEDEEEDNTNE